MDENFIANDLLRKGIKKQKHILKKRSLLVDEVTKEHGAGQKSDVLLQVHASHRNALVHMLKKVSVSMYLGSLEHLSVQTLLLYYAPLCTDHRQKGWSLPSCVAVAMGNTGLTSPIIVSHMSSWYTLTCSSLICQEKVKYK